MRKILYITIISILFLAVLAYNAKALTVGVVSDIHAGKKAKRVSGTSTTYPKLGAKYFDKALAEMNGRVDLVVALGDNTHEGGNKYYKQLKKIEKKRGIKVLWVKGNHDKGYNLAPLEYTHEQGGIKFAVVNNTDCFGNFNCKHEYPDADVILQHIPPFYEDTCDFIPGRETIKIIWSGHWHSDRVCGYSRIFPALTEHKKLNYKIINL